MTKPKKKEKREIPLRASGETIVKAEDRPSKVLFDLAIEQEKEENAPPPTTPYHPLPISAKTESDIAPKRDYTKVANSINRNAVPSGLFKGTSKTTYDVLYQRTRGAINPTRIIKAVHGDVLLWTKLSHNTLRAHLRHLQSVGLVIIHYKLGDNSGAEYEVFLPEEINADAPYYHPLPPPTTTTPQKLVGGTYQKLVGGGGGQISENIEHSEPLKTSFKDINTIDDEPFGAMNEVLKTASAKISGKNPQKSDSENWKELAELLVMELEIAAARTNSISNVPAFLTEHLHRRLLGKTVALKQKASKLSRIEKDSESELPDESYKAESLTEEGRETVLKTIDGFLEKGQKDFVLSLEKTYTPEDWQWLVERLGKKY